MGICETQNNNTHESNNQKKPETNQINKDIKMNESIKINQKKPETNKINKDIKMDESIKINETKNKNDRIKECIIQTISPFEKIDRQLTNVSKSVCKIKIENISIKIIGTGF